ncbi:MAG: HvfC/BufC family peptide modification chaperone [Candidatus Binataceae bacterium]
MRHGLELLQKLIYRLVTAPGGVADGLAAEPELRRAGLDGLIFGDQRLSAVDRLDIYANMYFYRLRDTLRQDYPATYAVLGADHFHNLVTAYLLVHRPHHPSLLYAGAHLPGFLRTQPVHATFPFISDLARLERAQTEVFVAADAIPLDQGAMRAVAAEKWAALLLRTHPAVQVLDLDWRVGDIVGAVEGGVQWSAPVHGSASVLVWWMKRRAFFRDLDGFERGALLAARDGAAFARICEDAAKADPSKDAPATIASMLARWLEDGLVVGA